MTETSPRPSSPSPGWLLPPRGWLAWAAAVITWGLLLFSYHHLATLAAGEWEPFIVPFINEMTGALTWGLLFFPIRWFVGRLRLTHAAWRRYLPAYFACVVVTGATATTMMWGMRSLVFPLAGLGPYDYGIMPLRYLMEFPMQVIGFSVMVFVIHAAWAFRDAKEQQIRTARIEASLAQAQVRSLRLQLQPHFLFNALNTVSSTMYEDPSAADEMIGKLSDLLRSSLRTAQTDEVPLTVELETLDLYVAIMQARFGDRLRVTKEVEAGLDRALVPSLLLQPLVENAIRHGNASLHGRGAVDVRASREADRLVLEVEDDGPGLQGRKDPSQGLGLSATAERLALLYGNDHTFAAGDSPSGGFLVRISMPHRPDPVGGQEGRAAGPERRIPAEGRP